MEAGQNPPGFDRVSLREFAVIIEASRLRDARLAWQAADFMRFAYHQPNDMPDIPGETTGRGDADADREIAAIRRRVKVKHDTERAGNGR